MKPILLRQRPHTKGPVLTISLPFADDSSTGFVTDET